jgi:hypothetical protein
MASVGRLIVSMTTIPERINGLKFILRNLQFQTRIPDEVRLYIPKKCRRNNKEYTIPDWMINDPWVKIINFKIIHIETDYGPFTKLFPILTSWYSYQPQSNHGDDLCHNNDCIVTIDDDNILEDHTLEELSSAATKFPGKVFCMMAEDNDNFYHAELLYSEIHEIKNGNMGGYRSICYPRSAFSIEKIEQIKYHHEQITNLHKSYPFPILDDDHLISQLLHRLNIPTYVTRTKYPKNNINTSNNIHDIINIQCIKNDNGVNNGSPNIATSREITKSYLKNINTSIPITTTSPPANSKSPDKSSSPPANSKSPDKSSSSPANSKSPDKSSSPPADSKIADKSSTSHADSKIADKSSTSSTESKIADKSSTSSTESKIIDKDIKEVNEGEEKINKNGEDDGKVSDIEDGWTDSWEVDSDDGEGEDGDGGDGDDSDSSSDFGGGGDVGFVDLVIIERGYSNEVGVLKLRFIEHSRIVDHFIVYDGAGVFTPDKWANDDPLWKDIYDDGSRFHVIKDRDDDMIRTVLRSVIDETKKYMLIVSNVDEIVNCNMGKVIDNEVSNNAYKILMYSYIYNCNWVNPNKKDYPCIVPLNLYLNNNKSFQQIRNMKKEYAIENGGWEFSKFNNPSAIFNPSTYIRAEENLNIQSQVNKNSSSQKNKSNQNIKIEDLDDVSQINLAQRLVRDIVSSTINPIKQQNNSSGQQIKSVELSSGGWVDYVGLVEVWYGDVFRLRREGKYEEGFDNYYNHYFDVKEYINNNIDSYDSQKLLSMTLWPLFMDEVYYCTWHWESRRQMYNHPISIEIYTQFSEYVMNSWRFCREYFRHRSHFDGNSKNAGVDIYSKLDNKMRGILDTSKIYNVCVLDGNVGPYDEVITMIHETLLRKGYKSSINFDIDMNSVNVMIGIGKEREFVEFPKNCIILNLEQIFEEDINSNENILKIILQKNRYWDYTAANATFPANPIIGNKPLLYKFGFCQENAKITSYNEHEHTIDVLFYGTINERRHRILQELRDKGYKVIHEANVRSDARISLIRKAKVILNIHYYKLFEIVRVGYLLNNCRFVISETSPNDNEWQHLHKGFIRTPYENIVETTEKYLANPGLRSDIANLGHNLYKSTQPDLPIPNITTHH